MVCIVFVYFIMDVCVRYWVLRILNLFYERVLEVIVEWKVEECFIFMFFFYFGGYFYILIVLMNNRIVWFNCKGGNWLF